MSNPDDTFAKYVLQTGMATDAQIAKVRERLSESGVQSTLPDLMVEAGIITTAQRENVEKKLRTQTTGIQQLGNYKLVKKIGEGGMGLVYLAEDTVAYRKVALKVLNRKYATDPEFLGRFRREAQALGRLNHRNIVAGFNVGEDKGYQYYVMEYCEGEPLDKRLKREKRLSIPDAIEITTQVARGLQYAHEHNTIHRDIKPGNIFMLRDKTVKILDMGLSKTMGETDSSFNTQAGVTVGTPHYISPEQARGRQDIDGRADIYSLGATLYHFITGQTPFEGPTSAVIMTKHLTDQLTNPSDIRRDCPAGLVHVIVKMMAKKPDDRYLNCAELVEDLEQVAAGRPPSSPALDPVHSSVMRPVRIGTSKHRPVEPELALQPASTPQLTTRSSGNNRRITGKRDPIAPAEDRPGTKNVPPVRVEGVALADSSASPVSVPPRRNNAALLIAAVAVVCLALGAWIAFGGGLTKPSEPLQPDKKIDVVETTNTTTASSTAAVTPTTTSTDPMPEPVKSPASAHNFTETTNLLAMYLKQRNFGRARERLEALQREVLEFDMYNPDWCGKLDRAEREIKAGETRLYNDFIKELIGPGELGPIPPAALMLFNGAVPSGGTDKNVKWSARAIKILKDRVTYLDGLNDNQKLTFEGPRDLLNPGPLGHICIDYNAMLDADVVVKMQTTDDKWKEFNLHLAAGRMRKADLQPGPKEMKGVNVLKLVFEFNTRDDVLAVYRIYLTH